MGIGCKKMSSDELAIISIADSQTILKKLNLSSKLSDICEEFENNQKNS